MGSHKPVEREKSHALLLTFEDICFLFQKLIVDFFIDLHAHSTLMNGFMYGNTFDDIERYERQALFPKLLCNNADDFSLANTNFNRDAVKAGTGRRYSNYNITFRI